MTEIKCQTYSVFIDQDIFKSINTFFKSNEKEFSEIFILLDEHTLKHCYPIILEKVDALKKAQIIQIKSGEENKNIETCQHIWLQLSHHGADRKSLIVNLGGGVIGDMGGFVASTFKRGIAFINIPTTLLSQVDASIGGKLGIDLDHLKNEIGLLKFPKAVFVNSTFLSTLPDRHILSGFAEIIKHALIHDSLYWQKIKGLDFLNTSELYPIIETSIQIKNQIVLEDPTENGIRKCLNFGHTIGHAFESYFLRLPCKDQLLHGEAIAIGMICEAFLSNARCFLSLNELMEITNFILSKYTPVDISHIDHFELIELMLHDKKNMKGIINFTLLSSIGTSKINMTADIELIKESLGFYIEQSKFIQ